jgi:DNA recombination protein RmuC
MTLSSFLFLLDGFVTGAVVSWLFLRTQLIGARERIAGKESELDEVRKGRDGALTEIQELQGRLNVEIAARSSAETKASRVASLESDLKASQSEARDLSKTVSELTTTIDADRQATEERGAFLASAREAMTNQFENLANEILEDKSKRFTEQNKSNLTTLLGPLGEQIKDFKKKVEDSYDSESQQRAFLRAEIAQLRTLNERMDKDAIELTNALKGQSKTLGNWGEFILEDILQKAGLVRDREYKIQETLIAEDGKRTQPDVVVVLPEGRHLVVDSKINLVSYQKYCSTDDKLECEQALKSHIAAIRVHIKELDIKKYQDHYQLNSVDFVLMFVPLEPAFIIAVRHDPTLFDDAFAKRIVVVCPSTLLATMRTVGSIWKQEYQKRNVMEIAKQSGALYDKFVGFTDDLKNIGDRLRQAQNSYESAHSKLITGKGSLVNRAENIRLLGAKASKKLPQNLIDAATDDVDSSLSLAVAELSEDTMSVQQDLLANDASNGFGSD